MKVEAGNPTTDEKLGPRALGVSMCSSTQAAQETQVKEPGRREFENAGREHAELIRSLKEARFDAIAGIEAPEAHAKGGGSTSEAGLATSPTGSGGKGQGLARQH